MKIFLIAFAAIALTSTAARANDTFPFGDPKAGAKLFEQKCAACHIRQFGSVATAFTRADRKATSAPSLLAWVQRCGNAMKADLRGEEEESLAAHLNEAFYKFR